MNLTHAKRMADDLMADHGLWSWKFQFDNAKRRFGRCSHGRKLISLSAPLTAINDEDKVRDTILHEIAHALAGHHAGHGPIWQRKCIEIGAKPERCYDASDVNMVETKYVGTCPKCQRTFQRHRLSEQIKRKGGWCPCTGNAYRPEESLVWMVNGRIMEKVR